MSAHRKQRLSAVCMSVCTDDNLTLVATVVDETRQLSYKPIVICSEGCLRTWAGSTVWHVDDDPRVASFIVAEDSTS